MVRRAAGYAVILPLAPAASSCGTSEEPDVRGTGTDTLTSSASTTSAPTTSMPCSAPSAAAAYIAASNPDGRGAPQTGDDRVIRLEPGGESR